VRSRVLTAIGLAPFVLGAFFCASPWPFLLLALATLALCTVELDGLLKLAMNLAMPVWVVTYFICFRLTAPHPHLNKIVWPLLAVGGLAAGCIATLHRARRQESALGAIFAPLWIVAPLASLVLLHSDVPKGTTWFFANSALMAILPIWAGDTAAIFAGKAFGKHPLAPSISPNKTVEGAIANLLACVLIAVPLGMWIGHSWWISAICGVLAGTLGQVGDLFESSIKRQVGVKDTGTLLPGHGGLLDRIDSLLFTAPAVFAVLSFYKLH
jgi:phosphatidate cytidylyltransferase